MLVPGVAAVLKSFAGRMSVLAVHSGDPGKIRCGLIALQVAMFIEDDMRDVLLWYSRLYPAANSAGGDADAIFRGASYLAEDPRWNRLRNSRTDHRSSDRRRRLLIN